MTEVLSLKKGSLDLRIPVNFEIVYFLSVLLLLLLCFQLIMSCQCPFLCLMAAVSASEDFFSVALPQLLKPLTKVSIECQCAVSALLCC